MADAYGDYLKLNGVKPIESNKSDPVYSRYLELNQTPSDVSNAQKNLGNQNYDGYCQTFAENMTGSGWKGGTAYEAWQNQQDKARPGLDGVQPGDLVYFAPDQSNGDAGHVGIYTGRNKMVSANYTGVEENDLQDWQKKTGQQILGYVSTRKDNN